MSAASSPAHRTPELMVREYAKSAESRGLKILIADAPAAQTAASAQHGRRALFALLPVLGVPVQSSMLSGVDSILSIAQMPAGIPVGTLAIGKAGAINAALLAVSILATTREDLRKKLADFRAEQTAKVLSEKLP